MLDDPQFAYQQIANKFGLTRQYIAQLAHELGINGRRRQRQRKLHRQPRVINKQYLPDLQTVVDKIKRSGFQVIPYDLPQSDYQAWRSQRMVFVNGVLCSIQLRKGGTKSPNGREYARFDVNDTTRRGKVALWAMRSGRGIRLYVIPLTHLRKVSSVYIPVEGKYAVGSHKPRKDWTRYEGAWHLLA